jgi:hypothetical protein
VTGIRPAVWICLAVFAGVCSCASPPPSSYYAREEALPSEPLYANFHILEIGSQIQDIGVRAISEAIARQDRDIPDYGPLSFTTSLGLTLSYRVTTEKQMDHHRIAISSTENPLSDEVALNLLHFVSDLLGVEIPQATRQAESYVLDFDLDREGQVTFLENLQTRFDPDDLLEMWKQSVLDQLSEPISLREYESR